MLILYFSIISQKRSSCGQLGAPSYMNVGGAGGQRAVDDVAVAGDPADVGRAPVDVVVAEVEDPLDGLLGEEVVAGRGVLDALGLAGRAAGVEDEQRGFAVDAARRGNRRRRRPSGRATRGRGLPASATSLPMRRTTTHFSTVGDFSRAASTLAFSGNWRAAAPAAVGGDHAAWPWRRCCGRRSPRRRSRRRSREWTAPIRAQASMAIANSGIIGM